MHCPLGYLAGLNHFATTHLTGGDGLVQPKIHAFGSSWITQRQIAPFQASPQSSDPDCVTNEMVNGRIWCGQFQCGSRPEMGARRAGGQRLETTQ